MNSDVSKRLPDEGAIFTVAAMPHSERFEQVDAEVNPDRTHLIAHAVRRWFAIILASALVFGAVAAYLEVNRAAKYTSETKVLLQPVVGNPFAPSTSTSQQVNIAMQTEAGTVTSPTVTKLVNKQLHTSLLAADPAINTTVPDNTQIIVIAVTARNAVVAQHIGSAYAQSFLAYRKAQAQASQSFQLGVLKQQLESAQSGLTVAAESAKGAHGSTEAAAQVQVYTNRVASIQDSIGQLQSMPIRVGSVIAPATLPKSPSGLPGWAVVILAVLCGLLLGLLAALWCERRDTRIRLSRATTICGVPLLADLTPRRGRHGANQAADEQVSVACVALTALSGPPTVIAFSAPKDIPGSVSSAVTKIGHSLAVSGYRVAIVDTTLAAVPAQVTDADIEIVDLDDLLRDPSSSTDRINGAAVRLVRSPTGCAGTRDLLAGPEFGAMVARMSGDADYVLVSCEPLTTAAGSAATKVADALVLCVVDRVTTEQQVADAVARAARLGVTSFGSIGVGPAVTTGVQAVDAGTDSAAAEDGMTAGADEVAERRDNQDVAQAVGMTRLS